MTIQEESDALWDRLKNDPGWYEILPGILAPIHIKPDPAWGSL